MKESTLPLKQLGLTHLEVVLPQLLEQARREQWTSETVLARALGAEIEGRDRRANERRLKAARMPGKKTLESFAFSFQPSLGDRPGAGVGRPLVCPGDDQGALLGTAGHRKNTPEPGVGRTSTRRWPHGPLYDASRAC